jgi:hypothetical protein
MRGIFYSLQVRVKISEVRGWSARHSCSGFLPRSLDGQNPSLFLERHLVGPWRRIPSKVQKLEAPDSRSGFSPIAIMHSAQRSMLHGLVVEFFYLGYNRIPFSKLPIQL